MHDHRNGRTQAHMHTCIIMSTRVVSHLARSDTPNITWVVWRLARNDTPHITWIVTPWVQSPIRPHPHRQLHVHCMHIHIFNKV